MSDLIKTIMYVFKDDKLIDSAIDFANVLDEFSNTFTNILNDNRIHVNKQHNGIYKKTHKRFRKNYYKLRKKIEMLKKELVDCKVKINIVEIIQCYCEHINGK